jgi:hypothetical protein
VAIEIERKGAFMDNQPDPNDKSQASPPPSDGPNEKDAAALRPLSRLPAGAGIERPAFKSLSAEEIERLSESDQAIYIAAARDENRRKSLRKREDAKDPPGKGGGWDINYGM